MRINVLITGRSYHLAQAAPATLELPDGAAVAVALAKLDELLPPEGRLPAECLVALNGRHLGTVAEHGEAKLAEGDELVLIAPVSGG